MTLSLRVAHRVVVASLIAVLLSSCSESDATFTGRTLDLMTPIEADDDSEFYGVGATDVKTDQYGNYAALAVTKVGVISDLGAVIIDDAVTEHFDAATIEKEAIYLADFLVGSYIDTPLVFDDSAAVRDQYWADTAVKWGDVDYMRTYFDGQSEAQPWAVLDDDRGEWRQNGDPSYTPAPYVEGQPRTKLQHIELVSISYDEVEWRGVQEPLMKYRFTFEYDREVVTDGGSHATEHTSGHVVITAGWLDGLAGTVVGLNWGRSTWLGHYIEGGVWGLYPISADAAAPLGQLVIGDRLNLVMPQGFSMESDMERAQERGIELESAEAPDAEVAYFEGPAFGPPEDPFHEYVVTRFNPTPVPDVLRPSDALRKDAGQYGEDEVFVPFEGEAHRLTGSGIETGYLSLAPAVFDEIYDTVTVYVDSTEGPTYLAVYWVEKGRGAAVHEELLTGWTFTAPSEDAAGSA